MENAYFKHYQEIRSTIISKYMDVLEKLQMDIRKNKIVNEKPIISIEHNYIVDSLGLTGTWCTYVVGEKISKEEYEKAYVLATEGEFEVI